MITTDTIRADLQQNKAGTRTFAPCTAWVNFNGGGVVAIRGSENVSSITDSGAGVYDVVFLNPMDNAFFVSNLSSNNWTSLSSNLTTSSVRAVTGDTSFSPVDTAAVQVAIHGGIA